MSAYPNNISTRTYFVGTSSTPLMRSLRPLGTPAGRCRRQARLFSVDWLLMQPGYDLRCSMPFGYLASLYECCLWVLRSDCSTILLSDSSVVVPADGCRQSITSMWCTSPSCCLTAPCGMTTAARGSTGSTGRYAPHVLPVECFSHVSVPAFCCFFVCANGFGLGCFLRSNTKRRSPIGLCPESFKGYDYVRRRNVPCPCGRVVNG